MMGMGSLGWQQTSLGARLRAETSWGRHVLLQVLSQRGNQVLLSVHGHTHTHTYNHFSPTRALPGRSSKRGTPGGWICKHLPGRHLERPSHR